MNACAVATSRPLSATDRPTFAGTALTYLAKYPPVYVCSRVGRRFSDGEKPFAGRSIASSKQ